MSKRSMSGKHYGMLRAINVVCHTRINGWTQQIWECRCECGRTCTKSESELKHTHKMLNCGSGVHRGHKKK